MHLFKFLSFLQRMLRFQLTLIFCLSLWKAEIAVADPALERARNDARMERVVAIAEEIQLDKKQEKVFWKLYDNYQQELKQLGDKRVKLIDDAKKVAKTLTDAQASDLIRRSLHLEENRLSLKRRHVALFLEKLPPRTVARFFQLDNRLQMEVEAQLLSSMPLVGQ